MVLSGCVVSLMDGNRGVDNFGLDSLLLDDRDNSLMDVMMDMLASHGGSGRLCMMGLFNDSVILEVSHLGCDSLLGVSCIVMVELSFLGRKDVVGMLLWQFLLVLEGLDGGVVVMLVHFTVNGLCGFFMANRLDGLLSDGRADGLLDRGVVTSLAGDLVNCCSGCFHGCGVSGITQNSL
jgi:hypothetical protein